MSDFDKEYEEYIAIRGPLPPEPQYKVAEDEFEDREGPFQAVAVVW